MGSIGNATAGLQSASRLFERSAEQLAVPQAAGSGDTLEAVVGLLDAQNGFELNVAVMRMASDMQKRVLDILV